jgi:(4-(4-[2-(gamma-L-glutamylamino)ethyl]phenoxymethyl)furan-2-yl)methanamine synthase
LILPTNHYTIGWDIGGAHVKAVLVDAQGEAIASIQLPCELWKGLDRLALVMEQVQQAFNADVTNSVVTMTGELVDLFPNRHIGVCEIAQLVIQQLNHEPMFYASRSGFVPYDDVSAHTSEIASMNWHASAQYVSHHVKNALFVDIGSTTADMIPIIDNQLCNLGYSDAERMANNELVYTGVVRTPLMAVAQQVEFKQQHYHVAAEYFATIADVYRLLSQLPIQNDLADTADGQDKSALASARRIARMIGHDFEDASMFDWIALAKQFKHQHIEQLKQAMSQHLKNKQLTVVGAGAGVFLVEEIAQLSHCPYISVESLIKAVDTATLQQTITCFPAYAVARLANTYEL